MMCRDKIIPKTVLILWGIVLVTGLSASLVLAQEGSDSIPEISVQQEESFTLPIFLDPAAQIPSFGDQQGIESLDLLIGFDETVINASEATSEGGILDADNYGLQGNTDTDGEIKLVITGDSSPLVLTGSADTGVAFLHFTAVGGADATTTLSFKKFSCNESPVAVEGGTGFSVGDTISDQLKVVITPKEVTSSLELSHVILGLKILAGISVGEVSENLDFNEDRKIGTLDVLYILRVLAGLMSQPGDSVETMISEKSRALSPDISEADWQALVAGNTDFAFDLYQAISQGNDSLFYSPYSISLALAMTYAGAKNETEQQMGDTLHFTLPQDQLHPAFNFLDLALASRGQGAAGQDDEGFRLNIANATWGQTGYNFLPTFVDLLGENYGAGLNLLDFSSDPEASRVTINTWVSDQTEEKIKDLIPQGAISALTRLVLTNAIYFNAAWKFPFDEEMTQDAPFYLSEGQEISVPTMYQTEEFGYVRGEGYQAVELLYDGDELSMVILLPDEGNLDAFESSLNRGQLDTISKGLVRTNMSLSLPKFKYESGSVSLKDTLTQMGMPAAFGGDADFSGINGTKSLFISDVIHKAFVSVDEAGTEAAAATAVIMDESVPPEPISVAINGPFIFLIRDIQTGAILFVGKITQPEV